MKNAQTHHTPLSSSRKQRQLAHQARRSTSVSARETDSNTETLFPETLLFGCPGVPLRPRSGEPPRRDPRTINRARSPGRDARRQRRSSEPTRCRARCPSTTRRGRSSSPRRRSTAGSRHRWRSRTTGITEDPGDPVPDGRQAQRSCCRSGLRSRFAGLASRKASGLDYCVYRVEHGSNMYVLARTTSLSRGRSASRRRDPTRRGRGS